jgi:diphthamide biosynthesis protein 2
MYSVRTYRMPVLYVFGKKPADVQDAVDQLFNSLKSSGELPKRVVFRHYVAYKHVAGTSPDNILLGLSKT